MGQAVPLGLRNTAGIRCSIPLFSILVFFPLRFTSEVLNSSIARLCQLSHCLESIRQCHCYSPGFQIYAPCDYVVAISKPNDNHNKLSWSTSLLLSLPAYCTGIISPIRPTKSYNLRFSGTLPWLVWLRELSSRL